MEIVNVGLLGNWKKVLKERKNKNVEQQRDFIWKFS